MKKNLLLFVVIALFVISCSSDEESLPCITIADCPDSSFVCLDGECVVSTADEGAADNDGGNGGGSGTSDGNNSNGGGDNSSSDDDNGGDNGLPDPTPSDDDADSTADEDSDADTSDSGSDNDADTDTSDSGSDDDTDTSDTDTSDSGSDDDTDTSDTDTSDSGSDDDTDTDTSDSGSDNDTDTDTSDSGSDDDTDTDTSDSGDSGHDAEEPADLGSCAAAIAQLPHGGIYDWEDGTSQGFSDYATYANPYWNVVPAASLPAEVEPVLTHGGSYSFGNYSTYKPSTNHYAVLPATDLSQCSHCKVKAKFYVRGANWITSCDNNNYDYLESTCKGSAESSWVDPKFDDGYTFLSKRCTYSKQKWTELEWTIPESCKTETFLFGLRFKSDSSVEGPGLVVDNLTISITTSNEPVGAVESAENGKITGWACDLDAASEKVIVKVQYHKNKDESVVSAERKVYAEIERTDLTQCGGTFYHGFKVPFDAELATALGLGTHSATVFIGDLPTDCAGTYKKIGTKEFEITSLDPKQQ